MASEENKENWNPNTKTYSPSFEEKQLKKKTYMQTQYPESPLRDITFAYKQQPQQEPLSKPNKEQIKKMSISKMR